MKLLKMKRELATAFSVVSFVCWSGIIIIMNPTNAMSSQDNDPGHKASSTVSLHPAFDRDRAHEVAMTMDYGIELSISIVNPSGTFGKYNLLCIAFICLYNDDVECVEHQRTETIKHEANPTFARKIMIPYSSFQEEKVVLFAFFRESRVRTNEIIHLGENRSTLKKLLGSGITKLSLRRRSVDRIINTETIGARIIIHAEKLTNNYSEMRLTLAGVNLMNSHTFGSPDPYVEIYKRSATVPDEYILVHRTKTYKSSANPVWDPIDVQIRNLCNGEYDRALKFVVLDWSRDESSKNKCLGEFSTSFNSLLKDNAQNKDGREGMIFPLVQKDDNIESPGKVKIFNLKVTHLPSFADSVRDGLRLRSAIAIDFTTLNGDYERSESFHHLNADGTLNQYEKALTSVVNAMEIFGDKKFSLLGFGGECNLATDDLVFNMDTDGSSKLVGIEEILKAYRHYVENVTLSWPPRIETVIQKFMEMVNDSQDPNDYFVLFVLTRGRIVDGTEVEKVSISKNMALVALMIIRQASELPLSMVFVGIGENVSEFASVRALDAESVEIANHRDVVHFVQFSPFDASYDSDATKSYLESELLLEIPNQVVSHMRSRWLRRRIQSPQNFELKFDPFAPRK